LKFNQPGLDLSGMLTEATEPMMRRKRYKNLPETMKRTAGDQRRPNR
jgi:hypothetical protein